ncbi:MAG: outer membrane lipoprotein-sorting protein [Spirochaetaceae bacterium]|nr:outer membrane lipoprotein-sorting protein [Spirochaetaceae bacterium]
MYNREKKISLLLTFAIIFLSFPLLVFATPNSEHMNLLRKVDYLVNFTEHDLSAEYTIQRRDPGGAVSTTVATMFRRDRTDQFLILILEPLSDRGKGYLKQGDNLWLYDPVSRSFTFTSARERFQNSSARNSDFNRSSYSEDYTVVSARSERLGTFNCTVLDLQAVNTRVSFPRVRLWVCENNLVRQIQDFSLSGQLMRTTAIPTYQRVGDKWLPVTMVILDHLVFQNIGGRREYERTTITIRDPSLQTLPNSVYTKEYLERVNERRR